MNPSTKHSYGEGLTLAILVVVAGCLFLLPLSMLAKSGFTGPSGLSLNPVLEALGGRSVRRALWNSLESGLISALCALLVGVGIAFAIGLTNVRFKGTFTFLLLVPMMIPPHVTAIAWVQALGPSSQLLQLFNLAPEPGTTHALYSRSGVIALLSIQHMPLVFLVVLAALRALPRDIAEAARVAGAKPFYVLRKIIVPLLKPILISAYALAFVAALGNFGIPALLGIPARYTTLPVLIWQRLSSFGPNVLQDVAVIAVLLSVIAIATIALQITLLAKTRAPMIGPPQPPLMINLGKKRYLVELFLVLLVLATFILPATALMATALVKTYGLPLNANTLTLDHFSEILFRQSATLRAFFNSTLTAGVAGLLIALMCVIVAHFLHAKSGQGRLIGKIISTLAETTYAIPGLVISIAFILAFIKPIPLLNMSIYNTLLLIGLAYICAFFSIALKPINAATAQLDPALDEAARVSGATFGLRLRRIFIPAIAPAAASGVILVFLTAYNEVTVSALLWSSGNETIGTAIYNYEDGGYTTLAAAMSAITVAATVVLMFALDRFGRHLPQGVIPWRV